MNKMTTLQRRFPKKLNSLIKKTDNAKCLSKVIVNNLTDSSKDLSVSYSTNLPHAEKLDHYALVSSG